MKNQETRLKKHIATAQDLYCCMALQALQRIKGRLSRYHGASGLQGAAVRKEEKRRGSTFNRTCVSAQSLQSNRPEGKIKADLVEKHNIGNPSERYTKYDRVVLKPKYHPGSSEGSSSADVVWSI
ncbi:hypothetical protein OUZ56_027844 [Daphnia magna]|uniref:Uncharacterized protein n=1 Tax=Daphnia magna TaxID=35525 RepID=A0ABR0B239_9CRUS|nr:hypothetical protein OUZ56_027844 [Daphnia magna]